MPCTDGALGFTGKTMPSYSAPMRFRSRMWPTEPFLLLAPMTAMLLGSKSLSRLCVLMVVPPLS